MKEEILDFIASKRTCVLAVEMMDGSPHAATVHVAHASEPLIFYFDTNRVYRKSEPLYGREKTRASLVVGTDETVMKTLQIDGEIRLVSEAENEQWNQVYLGKFPGKAKKSEDPGLVRFMFTPTWWRFTDWTKPTGKIILVSDKVDFKL